MIRLLLKLGFAFMLLCPLCIVLIGAQPYDDSELRAFLTPPEGCPAPCFMGIRPGVTTVDEAKETLEAAGWNIEGASDPSISYYLFSPPASFPHIDHLTIHVVSPSIVRDVTLDTRFPFGILLLEFGEPDASWFSSSGGILPRVVYFVSYTRFSLTGVGFINCPLRWSDLWKTYLSFTFWASPPTNTDNVYVVEVHIFTNYSSDWLSNLPFCG